MVSGPNAFNTRVHFFNVSTGFKVKLSHDVPRVAASSIEPLFQRIKESFGCIRSSSVALSPNSFDWALHPGGLSVIEGAAKAMHLGDDQLRATKDIYKNRGNTSSAAVISVLDKLRHMGRGRDQVIACSFGPGMRIEMACLVRCRN